MILHRLGQNGALILRKKVREARVRQQQAGADPMMPRPPLRDAPVLIGRGRAGHVQVRAAVAGQSKALADHHPNVPPVVPV